MTGYRFDVKFIVKDGNCEVTMTGENQTLAEITKLIENPYVLKISIVDPTRKGINGKPKKP